jgi:hypothetical protein
LLAFREGRSCLPSGVGKPPITMVERERVGGEQQKEKQQKVHGRPDFGCNISRSGMPLKSRGATRRQAGRRQFGDSLLRHVHHAGRGRSESSGLTNGSTC